MTEVTLSCGRNGAVKTCEANGHACSSRKGSDVVCAAVSAILKTAMLVLSHTENVAFDADVSARGKLAFRAGMQENLGGPDKIEAESRLRCVADFIRSGVSSVSDEYPGYVLLRENTIG